MEQNPSFLRKLQTQIAWAGGCQSPPALLVALFQSTNPKNPCALCLGAGLAGWGAPRTRGERGSSGRLEEICIFLRAHPANRALCSWRLVPTSHHKQISPRPLLFSSSQKRPFSEFVLLHPPPPQICVSYSHLDQFCFPTECQSVVSYTAPRCSRPPDSHFLTNFLLTCILTIFSFTYQFGLNWRIMYWNSAKSST